MGITTLKQKIDSSGKKLANAYHLISLLDPSSLAVSMSHAYDQRVQSLQQLQIQ